MTLFAVMGGLALALASVGIYGLMAYSVGQRTHELGIRMALGAGTRDILGLIVGNGVKLAAIGVGAGSLVTLALARPMSQFLSGVTSADPFTFAGIAALLCGVSLVASYLPARRALRVDPIVSLRAD